MTTPRERFRSQMREEVKAVALAQLADGGPQAVSVNAIGRALGVSGPGLYRYFASRDALLTELVLDAYSDLAAALAPAGDLEALAGLWRRWALAQPHRYRLLFAAPIPGYDAHSEPIVAAAHELMRDVVAVLPGLDAEPAPPLDRQLARYVQRAALDGSVAAARWGITVWTRLHGHVSLEIEGNFASMGLDADALFADEVAALRGPLARGARAAPAA